MLTLNTTHYDAPKEHLVESLGLLPHWVVEYILLGESDIVQYMTKRWHCVLLSLCYHCPAYR